MTTVKKLGQGSADSCTQPYSPQRDLPMPSYRFQTPIHVSGGIGSRPSEKEIPSERKITSLKNLMQP
jgi:hypothetical protein